VWGWSCQSEALERRKKKMDQIVNWKTSILPRGFGIVPSIELMIGLYAFLHVMSDLSGGAGQLDSLILQVGHSGW
jgi:hypothetical protein